MKRALLCVVVSLLAAAVLGCGARSDSPAEPAAASAPAGRSTGGVTLPADLDRGPRAGESSHDLAQAKAGESLFRDKGCSACHTFGKRVTGPDLAGVSMRRTARWLEQQILHPDVMVKQDPTARQLFAQYALQMPNQGLTPDEAHAIIEFLKHRDHEAGEGREAGKE